jgi:hypothetical protein
MNSELALWTEIQVTYIREADLPQHLQLTVVPDRKNFPDECGLPGIKFDAV